jgi:multidrug resistance protein, MATE family
MHQPVALSPFRAELRDTLRLAAPLVLANLLQMAVYAVDVIFVARLGQEALAAASLATSLFGLIGWTFSALTGAVAPLIAAELGRRRHAVREVRRSIRMALWLALVTGLAGMALCLTVGPLMRATGQDPVVASMAERFILVLAFSLVPMIAANVLRTFVSALGRPVFATMVTALAIAVNAFGNWVFVFGNLGAPALGLEGSAISTIITGIASFAAYALAIARDRRLRRYRIFGRWWRPEWSRLREILRIGAPIGLIVVAEGGLFGSAAYLMGRIGPAELAAHAIALQVASVFFQIPFGIAQAATIRVGYHFGAGDRAGIGLAGRAAVVTCIGFQLAGAAVMLFIPRLILSAYVDTEAAGNAAMVGFAMQYLVVAAAFQLFDGVQAVAGGALRGLQDTRVPMVIAVLGYWLPGFGTAAYLGLATPLEGTGVWIGLAAGLVVVAALLLRRWYRRETLGLMSG